MKKHLEQIIKELKKSKFKCVAGCLENHSSFLELEKIANDKNAICCLGAEHKCILNVNDGYCCAHLCQYKVHVI